MLVTKRVQLCHAWEGYMQCVESAAWRRIPLQWQRLTTSTGSWQLFIFVKVPLEKWQRPSRPVRSRLFSVPIGLRHSSYFFSSKGRYDLIWEKYKSWVNLRPTYVVTWMTKGAFREKKWQKKERKHDDMCEAFGSLLYYVQEVTPPRIIRALFP